MKEARGQDENEVRPGLVRRLRVGDDGRGSVSVAPHRDRQVRAVGLRGHLPRQPYELGLLVPRQGDGLTIGPRQND